MNRLLSLTTKQLLLLTAASICLRLYQALIPLSECMVQQFVLASLIIPFLSALFIPVVFPQQARLRLGFE
jgi:hypothetical protein